MNNSVIYFRFGASSRCSGVNKGALDTMYLKIVVSSVWSAVIKYGEP